MNYLDTAKNQVLGAVSKVMESQPRRSTAQTVTIACPLERIEQFWRDSRQLSVVLGDVAEIDATGEDRYRWRLVDHPDVVWHSRLVPGPEGVRFVGTGDGNQLVVSYRPAPHDLGTEVTLRVETPVPGLLTGALAYKMLYRLRSLMQTREVPTIKFNPSARKSAR